MLMRKQMHYTCYNQNKFPFTTMLRTLRYNAMSSVIRNVEREMTRKLLEHKLKHNH